MISRTTARFRSAFGDLESDIKRQARRAYRLSKQNPHHPTLHFKLDWLARRLRPASFTAAAQSLTRLETTRRQKTARLIATTFGRPRTVVRTGPAAERHAFGIGDAPHLFDLLMRTTTPASGCPLAGVAVFGQSSDLGRGATSGALGCAPSSSRWCCGSRRWRCRGGPGRRRAGGRRRRGAAPGRGAPPPDARGSGDR